MNVPCRVFAAFALLCTLMPAAADATTFTAYDSGANSELLTSSPGDNVKRVLYSIDVGSLAAGDILVVCSDAGLTNSTGDTVRLSTQLILGGSNGATSGTVLDTNNAFGLTTDMQNGVPVKVAAVSIASSSMSNFVNLVVWTNGDLAVDQNFGRLQVLKIEP